MNRLFELAAEEAPPVVLRTIDAGDLEEMRVWKNANKAAFFFKGEISPADQKKWFEGYKNRPDDFMFMVLFEGAKVGCMGYRLLDGAVDCYNIMGAPAKRPKGAMAAAMRLMCSHIRAERREEIGCRVVKGNDAVDWYDKCGFIVMGEQPDHYQLYLDHQRFKPCAFKKKEGAPRA
jgi:RimJ/RimL family protein N-acetyltransferase